MNTRQINRYLRDQRMSVKTVDHHILLFKYDRVIRVFHTLNQVNEWLKVRDYLPCAQEQFDYDFYFDD